MNLVAEVHKIRQMVDPDPGYWLAILIELGELLDTGAVLLDGRMTSHTFGRCWQPHIITGVRHFVAVLTLPPEG